MAVSLYCPNCGENLGKDKECFKIEYCGTCGTSGIINPEGYDPEENIEEDD